MIKMRKKIIITTVLVISVLKTIFTIRTMTEIMKSKKAILVLMTKIVFHQKMKLKPIVILKTKQ